MYLHRTEDVLRIYYVCATSFFSLQLLLLTKNIRMRVINCIVDVQAATTLDEDDPKALTAGKERFQRQRDGDS